MSKPTKQIDMSAYRAEVHELADKYLGKPLKDIELSGLVRDLVQGATKYGLEIPTDFMMVGKALMTLEGIGKELDPELDILGEATPHFVDLLKKRLSPAQLGNELWRGAERLVGLATDVPAHLAEVLDELRTGRLQIQTSETQAAPVFDRLGRRMFSGMVVASLNVAGAITLAGSGPHRGWLAAVLFAVAGCTWFAHVSSDWFTAWWAKGRKR